MLTKRFPPPSEIVQALAFTAFLIYGRMFYVFAWKLPSWQMYLTVDEILSILSYALVFALLESLGLVLILLAISFVLPSKWFKNIFVVRSAWLVSVWAISLMIYFGRMSELGEEAGLAVLDYLYPWILVTVLLAILAAFLSTYIRFMADIASWLADRTVIFLFIFLPSSFIGLMVMLFRNIH